MFSEIYGPGKFGLSFELFPPKTPAGERAMFGHVEHLMTHAPSYITCTYGAGGSTREKTLGIVEEVKQRFGVQVAAHLTCVGATREQLRGFVAEAERRGIEGIVALRGDPPQGDDTFRPTPGGLHYASELAALIHAEFPQMGVAVAGYPETHQEAESPEADLLHLKQKVAAGGQVVLTQLFYHNEDFFRFRQRCEDLGIEAPIVPGILPVTKLAQIQRITALCGAQLPPDFVAQLSERDDEDWQLKTGMEFATRQVAELLAAGVAGLHFYVLNKSSATSAVLGNVELPE